MSRRESKFKTWFYAHTIDVAVSIIAALLLIWGIQQEVMAGAKCDQWEEGYRDGYCQDTPYCYAPVPPTCIESFYRSERQAYMAGYNQGEQDRV